MDFALEQFRQTEIAEVTGISASTMAFLVKSGHAPESRTLGRGSARRYDFEALQQFALAGAWISAGVNPLPSMLLSAAVRYYFKEDQGQYCIPYGDKDISRRIYELAPKFIFEPAKFSMFIAAYHLGFLDELRQPQKLDPVIEIYDKRYGFIHSPGLRSADPSQEAAFVIEGWDRGSDLIRIKTVFEAANLDFDAAAALAAEMEELRQSSVAFISLNAGRAIRRIAADIIALRLRSDQ